MTKKYRKYRETIEIEVIVDGKPVIPEFKQNGRFFEFTTDDEKLQEALERSNDYRRYFFLVMNNFPETEEILNRIKQHGGMKADIEKLKEEVKALKAEIEYLKAGMPNSDTKEKEKK